MDESAWLVEKKGPIGPLYWCVDETGVFDWTSDHLKALRFSRRVDADAVAGGMLDDARAVEHGWSEALKENPDAK